MAARSTLKMRSPGRRSAIGRSPCGVAIGVPGEAQTHPLHPVGHVPPTGSVHLAPATTGPGTSQQILPGVQHSLPQQNSGAGHVAPVQGGFPHVPWSQYGTGPGHLLPQLPQLRMSLSGLEQSEPQQVQPQLDASQLPPELLDDVLVLDDELVDDVVELVVVDVVVVVELVVVPLVVVPCPPAPP